MLIDCVPYAKHHSCLRGRHNQENILYYNFFGGGGNERNEIKKWKEGAVFVK